LDENGWYVRDGVLIRYFGLEPDHYVLPQGVKKVKEGSFRPWDKPKTITLNEDLEEIGERTFQYSYGGDDGLIIPKSVKYIGEYGCSGLRKVHLYRSTETHIRAFGTNTEIIYLD